MKRILVTGANGQVGQALKSILGNANHLFWHREELNLANTEFIYEKLRQYKNDFDVIINSAAFTNVELAEEQKELCNTVNNLAVQELAKFSKDHDKKLIHISTDYVFDGAQKTPYTESSPTNPLSLYGITKRDGELNSLKINPQIIIVRTAWVHSQFGTNFLKQILMAMKEKSELQIVTDQIGAPTSAIDLAKALSHLAQLERLPQGIFHFTNKGQCSRYEYVTEIKNIAELDTILIPIKAENFPSKATRPTYSVLDTSKIEAFLDFKIPNWQSSLMDNIASIEKNLRR